MEYKLKKGSFVLIPSMLRDELNLGCIDMVICSIIYGFSQDGECCFNGSISYLVYWTNTSKSTVIRSLKKMVELRILKKETKIINGVTFCSYSFNFDILQNEHSGVNLNTPQCQFEYGGGVSVTPNNIIDNNIDNNKDIYSAKTKNKDELFEKAWTLYERKGSKKKALEQWRKLSQENRERAIKFIPQYKASNPEIKFRKDFERYISYEVWVDARTMGGEKQYDKETLGEGVYIMDGKKYFGKILIPYDTPKRPSTRHSWNAEDNRWEY